MGLRSLEPCGIKRSISACAGFLRASLRGPQARNPHGKARAEVSAAKLATELTPEAVVKTGAMPVTAGAIGGGAANKSAPQISISEVNRPQSDRKSAGESRTPLVRRGAVRNEVRSGNPHTNAHF